MKIYIFFIFFTLILPQTEQNSEFNRYGRALLVREIQNYESKIQKVRGRFPVGRGLAPAVNSKFKGTETVIRRGGIE